MGGLGIDLGEWGTVGVEIGGVELGGVEPRRVEPRLKGDRE